jgi:hypothetical protein
MKDERTPLQKHASYVTLGKKIGLPRGVESHSPGLLAPEILALL